MGEMFDIANADVLLGPSKACPHGELVSTLTEEINANCTPVFTRRARKLIESWKCFSMLFYIDEQMP